MVATGVPSKSRRPRSCRRRTLVLLVVAVTALLLAKYYAPNRLRTFHFRAQLVVKTIALHLTIERLQQVTVCSSEVKHLCWLLRDVIDAGFRGDVEVMAKQIAARPLGQPPGGGGGGGGRRGIVMSAGGGTYTANAFVSLYVLRRVLNCTLPVAIMYWGKSDRDNIPEATRAFFQAHISGVEFVDASALSYPAHQRWLFPPDNPALFSGWKVKVYSLYAAPFDEVLLLDGDSTPFADLAPLFDHPAYRQHGNMFWPDPWCHPVRLFSQLNITDPWQDGRPQLQTEAGQLLFNRRMHPDVLDWLLFLNTHDEFTYHYAYGDKDTFRAAFALAGKAEGYYLVPQPTSMPLYQPHGRGGGEMAVRGIFQHHPDGRLLFLHRAGAGLRKYDCKEVGDSSRPFTHLLLQPSCSWATQNHLSEQTILVPTRMLVTPRDCAYDVSEGAGAARACGLPEAAVGRGLSEINSGEPAVFEVADSMHVAWVQQQADAAFGLLQERRREQPTLC